VQKPWIATFVLMLIAVIGMVQPTAAWTQATATTQSFRFDFFLPAVPGPCGEAITVTETIHVVSHLTQDASGGTHFSGYRWRNGRPCPW
jgi:hypothetical protein